MADARTDADWNHTAAVLAMLYNVNRGKNQSPATPADYHPGSKRRTTEMPPLKVPVTALKGIFVKGAPN